MKLEISFEKLEISLEVIINKHSKSNREHNIKSEKQDYEKQIKLNQIVINDYEKEITKFELKTNNYENQLKNIKIKCNIFEAKYKKIKIKISNIQEIVSVSQ